MYHICYVYGWVGYFPIYISYMSSYIVSYMIPYMISYMISYIFYRAGNPRLLTPVSYTHTHTHTHTHNTQHTPHSTHAPKSQDQGVLQGVKGVKVKAGDRRGPQR